MGTNSSKYGKPFLTNFNFQNIKEDPTYGEVQIYTSKENRQDQIAVVRLGMSESQDIQKKYE